MLRRLSSFANIIDFSCQMTDYLIKVLREYSISLAKFTEWYSFSISQQLDEGKAVDDIKVDLKFSIFKAVHSG